MDCTAAKVAKRPFTPANAGAKRQEVGRDARLLPNSAPCGPDVIELTLVKLSDNAEP